MRWRVAGALLAVAAAGCARPSSPPGGEQDRVPPRVVSVSPVPFATLEDLRAPVRIEFDERLSIRLEGVTAWEDAVLVSPITGDVRVDRGRRSLEISIAGGWQPGLVYRVVVLPVFRDLFGNIRREPIELVFTTGAPIPPTAVAGFLEDRIAGAPVPGGRVEAVRRVDSVTYVAVSDTAGFFSLRNIPAGVYDLRAWLDQDRDRTMEFQEPQDTALLPLGFQDTVVVSLGLLPRDTTAARLLRAEVVDSQKVRLFFDDYFPPGPVAGRAALFGMPDSTLVVEGTLVHATALDSILARERAVADSLRAIADSLRVAAGDTAVAPGDTLPGDTAQAGRQAQRRRLEAGLPLGAARPPGAPGPGAGGRPAEPLPSRELIVLLPFPMQPGTAYLVEASGLTNIRGVPGGWGIARFQTAARTDTTPPQPEPVPSDTVPSETASPGTEPPATSPARPL